MVLVISEEVTCYFVHVKANQVLCENARHRLCTISPPLFREGVKYQSSDGQGSDCPPGRTATVPGKNSRNHSKSIAQHAMSRYVLLVLLWSLCIDRLARDVVDISGQQNPYRGSTFLHAHQT
jgi:hypothetical protein